jgi:hypothetical protein
MNRLPFSWDKPPDLKYAYTAAFPKLSIGLEWGRFKAWLGSKVGEVYTLDEWRELRDRFYRDMDAQSERETQAEALI